NDEAAVTPAEETGGVRTPVYAAACAAMTQDVQWAIAGARAAGAQEIIVADSHWYDTNLLDEDFDDPVVRGSQAALRAMDGADA
ncbi:M55 family metallopeptidase, partial [Staphylococcus arlettae]|uniref:M55 family metallopeptidase n=1 Tax=Staphylococcus arlettae TaxID=29378 RepID=UPI003CF71DFC